MGPTSARGRPYWISRSGTTRARRPRRSSTCPSSNSRRESGSLVRGARNPALRSVVVSPGWACCADSPRYRAGGGPTAGRRDLMARTGRLRLLLSVTLLAGLVLRPSVVLAQITLDATAPPGAPALGGPLNFTIPSAAGRLQNPNLFFSFGQFSVPTGGSATFTRSTTTPQASVSNIVGRVTGGQQSSIDGLLAV